jgi:hypothetical protein
MGGVMIVGLTIGIILSLIPFGDVGIFHPVRLVVLLMLLVALSLFRSLTVEINNGLLLCRFGSGIIRKSISLFDIEEFRTVRNPWYVGWGIRWIPGQYWLWNVSGYQAVEVVLKSGIRFRIGTDEPAALVQAIQANKIIRF